MAYLVPAVLGGLAITVVALVSLASSRRAKRERSGSAAALPKILIHSINDDRCTGCDACVAVCPTNVLDLVENKSRVLRFEDCIQCEACMWSCPTEALVMHPEGTEPPPIKQPDLDEFYQTAIPGQYLIGEVAGKPLVKNAANLGRTVIEHALRTGLSPGALHPNPQASQTVDVAIVGSGPGGLSTALSCLYHGLSYVLLEKEHLLASTIARYPKGKLIMAEPYESRNLSFLPVFDSSKEETIPIWQDLADRVGLEVKLGEAVEAVHKQQDGSFAITTTVAKYAAQRVVLATGLRGKPRTLGVSGENRPKVHSLLEDPDHHRGQAVCVVGGGDSALEAAIALADAGAKVVLSYRGRSFMRAQPKLKATVESYAAQRRIKVKYRSEVVEFAEETVTLRMEDGTQKRYPNEAAFVLIGADPPIKWLSTLGIQYVERPHMAAQPGPDELVGRLTEQQAVECPEHAAGAAALVQRRELAEVLEERPAEAASGPRKWLRSATNIFTGAGKLDKPMPLSEFAKQNRRRHKGHGRRDDLEPGERTRVLRMLRDEGARVADEESKIYVLDRPQRGGHGSPEPHRAPHYEAMPHEVPPSFDHLASLGNDPIATVDSMPPVATKPKQAVIVGLAQAAAGRSKKRRRRPPQAPPPIPPSAPPPGAGEPSFGAAEPAFGAGDARFTETPTRAIAADEVGAGRPAPEFPVEQHEEPTHLASFDPRELMRSAEMGQPPGAGGDPDAATRAVDLGQIAGESEEEATRAVDLGGLALLEEQGADGRSGTEEEPTRNIRLDENGRPTTLSDVEFDLD